MRKSISKKLRFEVFKRDSFECQYCGAHPPGILLHVDHIHPVADGGTNDIDNLVTSCESCNFGKGARLLSSVPESLKDKAKKIAESEAQIIGYQEVIMAKRRRIEDSAWDVVHVFDPSATSFNKADLQSIRNFVNNIGLQEVLDAADIASSKSYWNLSRQFRYFCGVCINKCKAAGK